MSSWTSLFSSSSKSISSPISPNNASVSTNTLSALKSPVAVAAAGIVSVVVVASSLLAARRRRARAVKESRRPGVVYLHQFHDLPNLPSASCFCVKLETFLMMNNIEYEIVPGLKSSSKGKLPWIEWNDETIADSQFIIRRLSQTYNIDMDRPLTAEQKAVSTAVVSMIEDSLYWTMVYSRWLTHSIADINCLVRLPVALAYFVIPRIIAKVRKSLHGQGYGRHSVEEIKYIANKQLAALSQLLGQQPYLFGWSVSFADVVLFSFLATNYEVPPYTCIHEELTSNKELANLVKFIERFKAAHWKRAWGSANSS